MVFDAHDEASPVQGRLRARHLDNRAAVETIFVGNNASTIAAFCRCAALPH